MSVYLIMVIVLFFLAATDLVVGVSNDAVNFLNSAKGARAAKTWVIMIIASLGVLLGATFSSGMMEVARKGIFHPGAFVFAEIMVIYLAVMLTDVILLDAYNTMALPTSTTVSIVFELLGSAVAVSLLKIGRNPAESLSDMEKYINSDTALIIIGGILLSVFVAFTVGAIVQFFTRLLFTFKYEKGLARYGSIWGGICISIITYFILIKGAKGSSFMTADIKLWIIENTVTILLLSFVGWTIIIQFCRWIFKINIPKFIILVGTFALAFAFAGNDLVNFIGVPIAGLKAYQNFASHPGADPNAFFMTAMKGKVPTETYLLLIAGVIMVVTLWFSKKSKNVSKTELNMARQTDGDERFDSSGLSRGVVRFGVNMGKTVKRVMPKSIQRFVGNRFSRPVMHSKSEAVSFDMIRASMNLTVASILIAFATSLKLPLSTTYVTFMVSMGASMADRAWGRESAVYRISGVFTVIGGWFLTALFAFTVSMFFALLISWGKLLAVVLLFALALFILYKTFLVANSEKTKIIEEDVVDGDILKYCNKNVVSVLNKIPAMIRKDLEYVGKEDRHGLKSLNQDSKDFLIWTKNKKNGFTTQLRDIKDSDSLECGHFYLQMLHYVREFTHSMDMIIESSFEHVRNNHRSFSPEQVNDLLLLNDKLKELFSQTADAVMRQDFSKKDEIKQKQETYIETVNSIQRKQIKRIKSNTVSTRNSMLFETILSCMKDLSVDIIRLLKVQSKFGLSNIS